MKKSRFLLEIQKMFLLFLSILATNFYLNAAPLPDIYSKVYEAEDNVDHVQMQQNLFKNSSPRKGIGFKIFHKKTEQQDIVENQSLALTHTNPEIAHHENITIKTKDGLVRDAVLTTRKNAHGNIVMCHPAAYDKDFMIPYTERVFSYYNCIRFDLRRHGNYGKKECTTLGRREVHEVNAAADFIKNHPETKGLPTYGFGISLGATILIEAESQKHQFDGLILQAAFESLREQIKRTFPFFKNVPLVHNLIFREPIRFIVQQRYKIRLCKVNCVESMRKVNTPIFLMHSQNDPVVSFVAYEKLKSAGNHCIKKTWAPKVGRHTELFKTLPDLYTKKCNSFLQKISENKKHINSNLVKNSPDKIEIKDLTENHGDFSLTSTTI